MNKKISLIIPADSNNFYIEDILINILLWSLKPTEIIIIITSKNKIQIGDDLKKELKKKNISLVLIYKKNFFPGAARNIGILKSKYNYLIFLDINTLPFNKDWLKTNFQYLLKNKLDGILGQTYYMASNKTEKIIRASTFGKGLLNTIPGSIFTKKTVLKVGFFDSVTRAGEDTEWLKRLTTYNLKTQKALDPVCYKGLYNTNYIIIIKKWFRNYYYSSTLPHMLLQKNFYVVVLFVALFFFVYNLNLLALQWKSPDKLYFPHVTKIFLISSFIIYTSARGVLMPLRKKINIRYLFPYNFFLVTLFSFILDCVKMTTFFLASLSKLLSKNIYKSEKKSAQ
tara:strand:+ start:1119 stop:2138 length:1020 start_codon:yes stop_codon:yes gene_type:complete